MALTSPDKLTKALAAGRRGGVFFLFGEEEFLKEEAAAAITAAHLDPATRDFNYDQLRGADLEPETLASIAHTPPMMAEWRVVVVRDAQALGANARSRAAVESLLARKLSGLVVILVATLPDRTKAAFYEKLKKECVAVEFAQLSDSDLPGWLVDRAAARGVELDIPGARALAATGREAGVLVQELAKLADYVADRKRITKEDVAAIVGSVPRQNRWDWFDMVGDARFREARAAIPVLLDASESGVGLVIGLGTHFLRLGIAAAGGERALGELLPPHQRWLAGRVAKQARRWNATAVEDVIDDLLRADRLLKSASLTDRQVLEELLLRMEQRMARNAA
ncbi:MAG TPA: DNA polymerase III subunit delta [Longimicrobiales bacterium]|nr:DNA polymerase III subunit delta [Longimicrobiales bacterium]